MPPIEIPTEATVIQVCEDLLAGLITREEVFAWTKTVLDRFGNNDYMPDFKTGNRDLEFILDNFLFLLEQYVFP